jgi:L-asparaginase
MTACSSSDTGMDPRKKIAILSTGGTIEMLPGSGGLVIVDGHNPLPMEGRVVPEGTLIDHVKFCSLPSPAVTPDLMGKLCIRLEEMTDSGSYDGIVVTHGTDTLEESAFLADAYLKSRVPVVFTAAMRSVSEMGVDGPRNVRGAILAASNHEIHKLGVTVVLNDEIHAAGRVTKTYTSNVSSFASPGYGPLGFVDQDRVLLQRKPLWRVQLPDGSMRMDQRVGLVRIAAGLGSREIRYCVECGDRAVVVEALGRGNVPPEVSGVIEHAVENGVMVFVTSRCYVGRVLGVYDYVGGGADLERRGAILAGDMQGHKLRLLIMAALGMGMDRDGISSMLQRL